MFRDRSSQSQCSGQSGVTLVELIISIVIISIAVTGVLLVFASTVGRSADVMQEQQAAAIAQAYLEEILLHPFADPTGVEVGETRATFDDVDDFDGLSDNPPRNQTGATLPNLADYTVSVNVVASGALGPGGSQVPVAAAFRVDVLVTTASGINTRVSGYRANF